MIRLKGFCHAWLLDQEPGMTESYDLFSVFILLLNRLVVVGFVDRIESGKPFVLLKPYKNSVNAICL
jgi:hypothetical protein